MQDPILPKLARRNPDTVFLFGLCLLAGAGQLGSDKPPGSVEVLVPTWLALAWAALLIFGAVLVLAGVLWRNDNGLLIELPGRVMFGPAAIAYAVALSAASDDLVTSALAAAPFVGFGIACAVRAWQIFRRLQLTMHGHDRMTRERP